MRKTPPAAPAPLLQEEHRPAAVELDRDRADDEDRQQQQGDGDAERQVEGPLDHPRAAREAHAGEGHDRDALDVVEGRVRGEDVGELRDDGDRHVSVHGVEQLVDVLARAVGRLGQDQPVDAVLVDDRRDLRAAAEVDEVARRRIAAVSDHDQAVLGVAGQLACHLARAAAGADDQRAADLHDARQRERAHGAAEGRHEHDRRREEDERLERTEDACAEEAHERLPDEQERERARHHRVEQQTDLVEARDGHAAVVALVQTVGREGREQHDRRTRPEDREERVRAGHCRRRDAVRERVREDVCDRERHEIGRCEDAHAPATKGRFDSGLGALCLFDDTGHGATLRSFSGAGTAQDRDARPLARRLAEVQVPADS